MSEFQERPAGPILDELGVTVALTPTQRITEILLIAKVVDLEDGQVALVIASSGLDWIAQAGLLESARNVTRECAYDSGRDDE